jgi:hypothetical protein
VPLDVGAHQGSALGNLADHTYEAITSPPAAAATTIGGPDLKYDRDVIIDCDLAKRVIVPHANALDHVLPDLQRLRR